MGIYARGEANDINGVTWMIEIHDTTYSSTIHELRIGGGIFTRDYDGYDELYFTPFFTSIVNVPVVITPTDTAIQSLVNDLVLAKENQYYGVVKKNGTVWFIGNLLVDQVQYDDMATYEITFTFNDGLKRLQNYYLDYIVDPSTPDYVQDLDILRRCLAYTGFEQFYSTTDPYIASSINWFEIDQVTTQGTLFNTRSFRLNYVADIEENRPHSCYEIIEKILSKYGASIRFENGRWYVMQFENMTSTTPLFYYYSKLSAFNGSATETINKNITGDNTPLSTMVNTYLPMVRRVFLTGTGKSAWKSGLSFDSPFNLLTLTDSIPYFYPTGWSAPKPIKIKKDLLITHSSGSVSMMNIKTVLQCGSLYFHPNDFGGQWKSTPGYVIHKVQKVNAPQALYSLEYIINGPPTAGTFSYTVTCSNQVSGAGTFLRGFVTVSQILGTDNTDEQKVGYLTANNDITESSIEIVEDTPIFEGTEPLNFIDTWPQIYNGTSWVLSEEWAVGTSATSGIFLGVLLTEQALYHQRYPRHMYQGEFKIIDYVSYFHINFRSKKYAFKSGSFNAKMCQWEGEWVEILSQSTGVTVGSSNPFRNRNSQTETRDARNIDVLNVLPLQVGGLTTQIDALTERVYQLERASELNAEGFILQNVQGLTAAGDTRTLKAKLVNGQYRLSFEA